MASSGTLLSDLDGNGGGGGGGGDSDLVSRILADINVSGQNSSNPLMPPSSGMINSPNPNSVAHMSMDSNPATSHIIGKDHPSPADFAAAMHSVPRSQDAQMGPPPPMPNNMMAGGNWSNYAPAQQQQQHVVHDVPVVTQKNLYARIADELKTPILVAILVFVFSLPFLNILFSHYIPYLVKSTGDLTHIGLLAKAVMAGLTFWVLQRVIAPLVSL